MPRKPPHGEGRPPLPAWQELPDEAFVKGVRSDKGASYSWDFFGKNPDRIVPGALNNREQIIPVYKRLRELGYTHKELAT